MIIVTGEVRFGEGEVARLKPLMEATIAATRAEAGCEHYSYAVDLSDPDLVHVAERWTDQAAIDSHMASPHMAAFMREIRRAEIEAMSIKMYRAEFAGTLLGD